MKRAVYVVLIPVVCCVLAETAAHARDGCIDVCSMPPGMRAIGATLDGSSDSVAASSRINDEQDDESEEAPALTGREGLKIELVVRGYIADEMMIRGGVFRTEALPSRELVPVWIESIEQTDEDTFRVMVEMWAVSLVPSDFPRIGEVSLNPKDVPRSSEQLIWWEAQVRGPGSFQLVFEVHRLEELAYRVVEVSVSGRPGEERDQWR